MVRYFIYALILFSTSCTNIEKNSSPNIVIIFMDDLGYGDISNFGAINYKTPNIDRMANHEWTYPSSLWYLLKLNLFLPFY